MNDNSNDQPQDRGLMDDVMGSAFRGNSKNSHGIEGYIGEAIANKLTGRSSHGGQSSGSGGLLGGLMNSIGGQGNQNPNPNQNYHNQNYNNNQNNNNNQGFNNNQGYNNNQANNGGYDQNLNYDSQNYNQGSDNQSGGSGFLGSIVNAGESLLNGKNYGSSGSDNYNNNYNNNSNHENNKQGNYGKRRNDNQDHYGNLQTSDGVNYGNHGPGYNSSIQNGAQNDYKNQNYGSQNQDDNSWGYKN